MSRAAKKVGGSAKGLGVDKARRVAHVGEMWHPIRLWDAKARAYLHRRYYATEQRAHMGALFLVRWSPVSTVIEIVDARTGRLIGQYIHRVNGIDYLE
jgi:hypothetical protein